MNRCPISYEMCQDQKYAIAGLKLLSPKLLALQDFYYTAKEQRELALTQMSKISIQGIQPKFSTRLNVSEGQFEVVERDGSFIFKPPHYLFAELPQNEDLTMRLAKLMGLEVPTHGLIYNRDSSLTYFIRRFDRLTLGRKRACEDFSQLMQYSRDTKYESSIEKMIPVIEQHCTFPLLEKMKFFRLVLFNFLIGNEDAHLKNFSLIQRDNIVELSPAYDLVNSTIVIKAQEELALPLHGKKRNITRQDLLVYFGKERLGLSDKFVEEELSLFKKTIPYWFELIPQSFLSQEHQEKYAGVIEERCKRIGF